MNQLIGVDAIAVHIPHHFVDLGALAWACGVDPCKYYHGLGGRRIAVVAPHEDPVTMAVEASRDLIDRYEVDHDKIGLLVVGTESGVDGAKPIASFVHGLLGLPTNCRTFDTKHACYSGTAALRMAADWCAVRSGCGNKKALVVATDIARYNIGSSGEPTQGAGAVAILVSQDPSVLILDRKTEAVYAEEIMDFWRPHYRQEAVVDGPTSLQSYLRALDRTYSIYEHESGLGWDDFDYFLFHVPFPKMAYKAVKMLHERESVRRNGSGKDFLPFEIAFEIRTEPTLWANMEVGNIYSGSLYLAMAGLLERGDHEVEGSHLGMFSYGSGCCAEFFSGRVQSDASAWRDKIGIERALKRRKELSHEQYLAFRRAGEELSCQGSFSEVSLKTGERDGATAFCGIRDHQRIYLTHQTGGLALSNSARAQIGK